MDYARRVYLLQEQIKSRDVDALVISGPGNRVYLSGFGSADPASAGSNELILISPDRCAFITSNLYFEAAKCQIHHMEVLLAPVRSLETLTELLVEWGAKTAGFESTHITVSQLTALSEAGTATRFTPMDGIVEGLRAVKDEDELDRIGAAVKLTDQAFEYVKGILRPGLTEKEVAWQIERYLRENGAEGVAFAPAVASGPNSAVPHHEPSDRQINAGEPIWLDLGARLDGYCADLTRMLCLGNPSERLRETVGLVGRALDEAEAKVKPGVDGKQADAIARDIFTEARCGDAFIHSLGHGLGIDIHEAPRLSRFFEDELKARAVVTIEPGIYFPGWGGVRIEDTVAMVEDGIEILTGAPKDWIID